LAQPTAAPDCLDQNGLVLPAGPLPQNVVACVPPIGSTTTTSTSPGTPLNFTFASSAIEMTTSAAITTRGGGPVSFDGTPSTIPPDGDAVPTFGSTGNFNGTDFVCVSSTQTIASLGGQPAHCSDFAAPGWTCTPSAGPPPPGAQLGTTGPTTTLADQGLDATYAAFDCKDNITWSTTPLAGGLPVTFQPYVHTPTFVATGVPADFLTGPPGQPGAGENILAADGATAYVTFDQNNIYVGFDRGAAGFGATDIVEFYIGSSAGGTATSDNNTDATGSFNDGRTFPAGFHALYHVFYRLDNAFTNTSDKFVGTAWVSGGPLATIKYNGTTSTFIEFTIPIPLAGITGGDYHFVGAVKTAAPNEVGSWPAANTDLGNWTTWQAEMLTAAWFPNDTTLLGLE
jgi:hypothetical protein